MPRDRTAASRPTCLLIFHLVDCVLLGRLVVVPFTTKYERVASAFQRFSHFFPAPSAAPACPKDEAALTIPDMDWTRFRELFPVTGRWAFLDHAAVAPLSAPARDALRDWADDVAAD